MSGYSMYTEYIHMQIRSHEHVRAHEHVFEHEYVGLHSL